MPDAILDPIVVNQRIKILEGLYRDDTANVYKVSDNTLHTIPQATSKYHILHVTILTCTHPTNHINRRRSLWRFTATSDILTTHSNW